MIKFLIVFFTLYASLQAVEKVSLQLLWLHQFEFAGYYMAKEKGYYADADLDVEIKPYIYGLNIANSVKNNKSTYGVGGSSLLLDTSNIKPIKILAPIFQSSPLVFIATKESNIKSIKDFKGKRIMTAPEADISVALYAMMNRQGIHTSDLIYLKDSFDVNDLINKKTDIMSAYETNEPYVLKEKGVDVTIFDPKKYGFDFYNDILFTSYDEAQFHTARTTEFTNASLRGWEYAFDHIDETVDLIMRKYNTQHKSREALLFEAKALKAIAYSGHYKKLGEIDWGKLQRIYDLYNVSGLIKKQYDVKSMQFTEYNELLLNKKEHDYLQEKSRFSICVHSDLFPIDGIRDGIHTGIAADMYGIIAQKLGISFVPVVSTGNDDFIKNIRENRCDLISIASSQQKIFPNVTPTKPFLSTYMAFISQSNKPFIGELSDLKGKKILVHCTTYKNYLLKFDPRLKIEVCDSMEKISKMILNDEAYCAAVPYESAEWTIQKYGINKLKVNGFVGKDNPMMSSIGIVGNDPLLLAILNKTLQSIPPEKADEIKERWTLKNYAKPTNYMPASIMLLFFLLIFVVFLVRQRRLYKANTSLEEGSKRKSNELKESRNLLEMIFNSTRESMGIVDANTKFVFANQAYFNMIGYAEAELYQKTCLELTLEEDLEVTFEALNTVNKKGYVAGIEKRCKKSDGTIIDTRMSIVKINETDNYLIIAQNITDENRIKREQKQLEQQMLQQSRLAQMGEMIAMIAHQWRQPLGTIAATSMNMKFKIELESFDLTTQEGRDTSNHFFMEKLTEIEGHVENLTATIDDFRNFYRPDKKLVITSFQEVFNKAFGIIGNSMKVDNITLIEEYGDEIQLEMHDNEMVQVILNILKNAQDNFKEKKIENPQIKITAHSNVLFICDNGGGIPDEILEKIFDPYFSTKDEKNGTGLGLYMSKTIIEEHHNGKLRVRNQNGGVSFQITLWNQSSSPYPCATK